MAVLLLPFEVDHHVGQVSLSVLPGCDLGDRGSHSKHSILQPAGVKRGAYLGWPSLFSVAITEYQRLESYKETKSVLL